MRGGEMRLDGMEPRAGDLVLQLEEARPGFVRWRAISDDSHMTHFLRWRESIVAVGAGRRTATTKVTWTLRYSRGLDPVLVLRPVGAIRGEAGRRIPDRVGGDAMNTVDRYLLVRGGVALPHRGADDRRVGVAAARRPGARRRAARRSSGTCRCCWRSTWPRSGSGGGGSMRAAGCCWDPGGLAARVGLAVGRRSCRSRFPSPVGIVVAVALASISCAMPAAAPVLRLGPAWLARRGRRVDRRARSRSPAGAMDRARRAARPGAALLQVRRVRRPDDVGPAGDRDRGLGERLGEPLARPVWQIALIAQLLALPGIVGLSAVQEFVTRGGGTPVPFDPPKRIVTTGMYAYVRNPMQLSAVVLLLLLGVVLQNIWVAAAGVMAHLYSAGLAGWDEDEDLRRRFGDGWLAYRRGVRSWIPRLRPWHRPDRPPARLFVAESCGMCSEVGAWFLRARRPAARHRRRGNAPVAGADADHLRARRRLARRDRRRSRGARPRTRPPRLGTGGLRAAPADRRSSACSSWSMRPAASLERSRPPGPVRSTTATLRRFEVCAP